MLEDPGTFGCWHAFHCVPQTLGGLVGGVANTPAFCGVLACQQVIDEADRILEIGFEEEMRQIVKILPKDRQTMLFSATQTTKARFGDCKPQRAAGTAGRSSRSLQNQLAHAAVIAG